MRSSKCKHIGNSTTNDANEAMEKRIKNIENFQRDMIPKKAIVDDETLSTWCDLLTSFDEKLREAQEILQQLKGKIY